MNTYRPIYRYPTIYPLTGRQVLCLNLSSTPQTQGNRSSDRCIRSHWNLTTARISRGRHPLLRRLLTRSALGLDGSIIMYSAFHRLRHDCSHTVRDIEAVLAVQRPLLWLVLLGHRRKVEEMLVFYCWLTE